MSKNLDRFTDRFASAMLEAIEQGVAPWQQPWKRGERRLPANAVTGRSYRGSNLMMLLTIQMVRGWRDHRWAGYRQIEHAGGHVRRGERGTPVLIWKQYRPGARDDGDGIGEEGLEGPRLYCSLKHVFNAEQAEGLDENPDLEPVPEPAWKTTASVEKMVEDARVKVVHGIDTACYVADTDTIVMPERGRFESRDGYEHTLVHELGHATAHASRLNRPDGLGNRMGSPAYALEELRAEISAMITGERIGIGHEPRHGQAYVAHWVQRVRDEPNAIRQATGDAQRISDWLVRGLAGEAAEPLAA